MRARERERGRARREASPPSAAAANDLSLGRGLDLLTRKPLALRTRATTHELRLPPYVCVCIHARYAGDTGRTAPKPLLCVPSFLLGSRRSSIFLSGEMAAATPSPSPRGHTRQSIYNLLRHKYNIKMKLYIIEKLACCLPPLTGESCKLGFLI